MALNQKKLYDAVYQAASGELQRQGLIEGRKANRLTDAEREAAISTFERLGYSRQTAEMELAVRESEMLAADPEYRESNVERAAGLQLVEAEMKEDVEMYRALGLPTAAAIHAARGRDEGYRW